MSTSPACLICLSQVSIPYSPPNRPDSCVCHFDVHMKCYQIWIEKSGSRYHCLICRKTTAAPGEFPLVLYGAAAADPAGADRLNPIPFLDIPDLNRQQQQQSTAHWPLFILLLALGSSLLLNYLS